MRRSDFSSRELVLYSSGPDIEYKRSKPVDTRYLTLALFLLAITASGASATLQSHPFSQVFPPNEDLGFGGKDLKNASRIETAAIEPNQSDITFRDSGNVDILRYDDSQGRWEVVNSNLYIGGTTSLNSNLNMNGNRITNVPAPSNPGDAVNKSYVDTSDDTISDDQDLQDVLGQGNSAGSYNIDLNGNRILARDGGLISDIGDSGPPLINHTTDDAHVFKSYGGSSYNKILWQRFQEHAFRIFDYSSGGEEFTVDTNGQVSVYNGNLNIRGNDLTSANNVYTNQIRAGDSTTDIYSSSGGRILMRSLGSSGTLGWYDDNNNQWVQEYNNGADLRLNPVGNVNLESTNLELRGSFVSGDGQNEGVYVANDGDVGLGSGASKTTLNGTESSAYLNDDPVNTYGMVVDRSVNDPNMPAGVLVTGDGDGTDDIAFEVRGNSDGTAVHNPSWGSGVSSADSKFVVFMDGTTVIGKSNVGDQYGGAPAGGLEVGGNLDMDGNNINTVQKITSNRGEFSNGMILPVGADAY